MFKPLEYLHPTDFLHRFPEVVNVLARFLFLVSFHCRILFFLVVSLHEFLFLFLDFTFLIVRPLCVISRNVKVNKSEHQVNKYGYY